jgi:hypothetical protein
VAGGGRGIGSSHPGSLCAALTAGHCSCHAARRAASQPASQRRPSLPSTPTPAPCACRRPASEAAASHTPLQHLGWPAGPPAAACRRSVVVDSHGGCSGGRGVGGCRRGWGWDVHEGGGGGGGAHLHTARGRGRAAAVELTHCDHHEAGSGQQVHQRQIHLVVVSWASSEPSCLRRLRSHLGCYRPRQALHGASNMARWPSCQAWSHV